jgi:two-component system cell cycle sensor histidine kinase/response regulator CckA
MNEISHPTVIGQVTAATPGSVKAGAGGRVLVIDDDDAVGLVLSRAMARLGFTGDVGSDGPKGLAIFDANPSAYGLVLLDFKLPGMDSRTVHHKLREKRPELPIVLMSGYNRQEAVDSSSGMDFVAFLHKPFNMETLAAALRYAIVA